MATEKSNGNMPPAPEPAPHRAQLVITWTNDNAIAVSGPIDNMMVSYWMLEVAKDTVRRHHEQKAKSGILPWRKGMPNG